MGFFRQQEESLAARLLAWRYQQEKLPLPPSSELMDQASRVVDEAHRIARERGSNVLSIVKELIAGMMKK